MNFQEFLTGQPAKKVNESANPGLDALAKLTKGKPESEKKGEAVKKYVKKAVESKPLKEGFQDGHSILPATRVLYNKNKVTPEHIASEGTMNHGTIEHHRLHDGKVVHVSTYGDLGSGHEVGSTHRFHHDQTGAKLFDGHTTIVGKTHHSGGKIIGTEGEDHSKTAAPFHVYK